ncbi:MAG: hypothetical protein OEZ36_09440 [Spirochaetota bacterium]|nr:hypothetical protein [Spirochaetota bacterium]
MFSLHKNYIREQGKLVQELQDKLLGQTIQFGELADKLMIFEKVVPLFKKIAQIMAYYHPDRIMGTNLILQLLDLCEGEECSDSSIQDIENNIDNWEEVLIRESLETPFHPDEISKDELDHEIDELRKLMSGEIESPIDQKIAAASQVQAPAETEKSPEPPSATPVQKADPAPIPEQKPVEPQNKPVDPPKTPSQDQKVVENFGGLILVDED